MGSSSEVTTIFSLSLDPNRKNAKTQTAYSFCYCKHCEHLKIIRMQQFLEIRFIITGPVIGSGKKKTRKAPGGINPAVVLSALGVQNILRPGKSW